MRRDLLSYEHLGLSHRENGCQGQRFNSGCYYIDSGSLWGKTGLTHERLWPQGLA